MHVSCTFASVAFKYTFLFSLGNERTRVTCKSVWRAKLGRISFILWMILTFYRTHTPWIDSKGTSILPRNGRRCIHILWWSTVFRKTSLIFPKKFQFFCNDSANDCQPHWQHKAKTLFMLWYGFYSGQMHWLFSCTLIIILLIINQEVKQQSYRKPVHLPKYQYTRILI